MPNEEYTEWIGYADDADEPIGWLDIVFAAVTLAILIALVIQDGLRRLLSKAQPLLVVLAAALATGILAFLCSGWTAVSG